MRMTTRLLTLSAICAFAIALSPVSRAQQSKDKQTNEDQKSATRSDENRGVMETETIHGIVSAITAEGEIAFDYKNKRAVEVEAAFMTVVGTRVNPDKSEAESKDKATDSAQHHTAGGHRYHVYQVWMSPRTKVCECTADMSKHGQERSKSLSDKKECNLDKLEIGDHVQIQFVTQRDDSESKLAHQTEKMREKHGRHRTHVGYAKEITIMMPKDDGGRDNDRSRDRDENAPSNKR